VYPTIGAATEDGDNRRNGLASTSRCSIIPATDENAQQYDD
jgi:hypothetical protein